MTGPVKNLVQPSVVGMVNEMVSVSVLGWLKFHLFSPVGLKPSSWQFSFVMVVPLFIVIVRGLPVPHFSVVVKSLVVIMMVLCFNSGHCGSNISLVGGAGILGHSSYVPPVPMSARPHFSDVSELSK